jgi:hypothetical protein
LRGFFHVGIQALSGAITQKAIPGIYEINDPAHEEAKKTVFMSNTLMFT